MNCRHHHRGSVCMRYFTMVTVNKFAQSKSIEYVENEYNTVFINTGCYWCDTCNIDEPCVVLLLHA
jgi:hypothetical protein